jgi:hypothetical protein
MRDIDKFLDLYRSLGINLEVRSSNGMLFIQLEPGAHPLLCGYSGIVSAIMFDKEGKFQEQDFWED